MLVPKPSAFVPIRELSPEDVRQGLLPSLLTALERRWYDNLQITTAPIQQHQGGNLRTGCRFLQVFEIAHNSNIQQSLHLYNMQNVISSIRDGSHSLVYALNSTGKDVRILTGVRKSDNTTADIETKQYLELLVRAFRANYPGIVLSRDAKNSFSMLSYEQLRESLLDPLRDSTYLAAITGIPSLRSLGSPEMIFAQSIDRLVDALRGEAYTLLILAEPVKDRRLVNMISLLRTLGEEVHSLVRQSISMSQNIARTVGESSADSTTIQLGAGQMISAIFGMSFGQSWTTAKMVQETDSAGLSILQDKLNKNAEFCEQVLDTYVSRFQSGRSLGFWNVGIYIASSDPHTYLRAQGTIRSLYAGQQTYLEPLRVLNLTHAQLSVREALQFLRNPALAYLSNPQLDPGMPLEHPIGPEFLSLGTPLTTEELSILVNFPQREVPGIKLKQVADFNLNPPVQGDLSLGCVLYRGELLEDSPVYISTESLVRHTFIAGQTGFGKTNTCMVLLKAAMAGGKKFLVIEPAKREYRSLLIDKDISEPIHVFTLGSQESPFRMNPFDFEEGFPLLTHIDLLKSVFNAAFPMYASMPYLLEEALQNVYRERGWDVVSSQNQHVMNKPNADRRDYLPTLSDLLEQIEPVVRSKGYDVRLRSDLIAALTTRLNSLRQGGKGLMLDTQRSISTAAIINHSTVLELQDIGDDDEKAFVMAMLLIRLYEYCRVHREHTAGEFEHLVLIEEAHRLLKNVPFSVSTEIANTRGKSVEMFTDILAEVREYGEGFVIVDQIPSKLTPDVVKNTNLKIVHRLVAEDDRRFVGNAMGLNEDQKEHLVRLGKGEAVLHSSETYIPILMKVHDAGKNKLKKCLADDESGRVARSTERTQQKFKDDYRRWESCSTCTEPCHHLSSRNAAKREEASPFQRYFDAILYSCPEKAWAKWGYLDQFTQQLLLPRYDPTVWGQYQREILSCHYAQHARRSAAIYYSYYRFQAAGQHHALVSLQQLVMENIHCLLYEQPEDIPMRSYAAIQRSFREQMATSPAIAQPGCSLCQRKCLFGVLVQTHPRMRKSNLSGFSQLFVNQLEAAAKQSTFRGDLGKIRTNIRAAELFAADAIAQVVDVKSEDLPHLAYCFMVNFNLHISTLRTVQETIQSEKIG